MLLEKLNLPEYHFRFDEKDSKKLIFDEIRKRFVALTSEEWVRQNILKYLVSEKRFPATLISVEQEMKLFKRKKRTDIVVYNKQGLPLLIVECKAPNIVINQNVFDQIVRYNMALKVKYLVLTNGMNHYACSVDYDLKSYIFLKEIPDYTELK